MNLGIIQGRLLGPVDGFIQEFPHNWRLEFELLEKLDLSHVEWIVTQRSFNTNPIFFEDCRQYKISSLCADNLVNSEIVSEAFLDDNLTPICEAALKNEIESVTIPLLEESDITNSEIRNKFTSHILKYADKYPTLNFSFEAETSWENVMSIASKRNNFWITYDTGNITSQRINHEEYIRNTCSKINNVHIKDRTFDGQTVPPLSGDTDFENIFNILKEVGYDGIYTLQTARGVTGFEMRTIKQHKTIFDGMISL